MEKVLPRHELVAFEQVVRCNLTQEFEMIFQVTPMGRVIKKCTKHHHHVEQLPLEEDGNEEVRRIVEQAQERVTQAHLRPLAKEILSLESLEAPLRECDLQL